MKQRKLENRYANSFYGFCLKNGSLSYEDIPETKLNMVMLEGHKFVPVSELDMRELQTVLSLAVEEAEKGNDKDEERDYIFPADYFLHRMGYRVPKEHVTDIASDIIRKYSRLAGILSEDETVGTVFECTYPVLPILVLTGCDKECGMIRFSSPYVNFLVDDGRIAESHTQEWHVAC